MLFTTTSPQPHLVVVVLTFQRLETGLAVRIYVGIRAEEFIIPSHCSTTTHFTPLAPKHSFDPVSNTKEARELAPRQTDYNPELFRAVLAHVEDARSRSTSAAKMNLMHMTILSGDGKFVSLYRFPAPSMMSRR